MKPLFIDHALDWGDHYQLRFHYAPQTHVLSAELAGPVASTGRVEANLISLLTITVNGAAYQLSPERTVRIETYAPIELRIYLGQAEHAELSGHYTIGETMLQVVALARKLTVFETRMLSNDILYRRLPYPYSGEPPVARTDLHTHSSGQITAQALIDIALIHDIAYPTRLLALLHIPYEVADIVSVKRFFFPPTDVGLDIPDTEDGVPVRALGDDALARLRAALSIPADRQMTFGELEVTVYRYRTPISKHPDAAYDLLLKTAEDYVKQSVMYAEITATTTSLLRPGYIAFLHEALPRIEAQTGFQMRFLAGIPRNLPAAMLAHEMDTIRLMGISPYIVGCDFMGFEDTKIHTLEAYIKEIAAFAHAHDPQFTLRIHAGENRKNMQNVKESLRLAEQYHMRVRIGHAAHGLDDGAIVIAQRLAAKGLVIIEFNPDSNLALNNIDRVEELNIVTCLEKNIPFVICSDGGGIFQTDARQLGITASFAAAHAGIDPARMQLVLKAEEDHLSLEHARFARKQAALPNDFLTQNARAYAALAPAHASTRAAPNEQTFEQALSAHGIHYSLESIAEATAGKEPLLILGATGERNWNAISPQGQQAIAESLGMLAETLDPTKVYFLIGRPKDEGITTLLSYAVYRHRELHPDAAFTLVSATVQADQTLHSFTPGLTHVLPLKDSLFNVPEQLVSYVGLKNGHMLCIGGATFVRDAILIARDRDIGFGLMQGPEGASTDKAVMMHPGRVFTGAHGMLEHLLTHKPHWFKRRASHSKNEYYSKVRQAELDAGRQVDDAPRQALGE